MDNEAKFILKIVVFVCIGLFILITFFGCFKTVPTGYVGIKTQFGKVQDGTIQEGLNFKIPYIEKVITIDCRTQKIEVTSESSSKDLQTVEATIVVNYHVDKNTANVLYKEVGINYQEVIIQPAILESVKSVMAQYTAEDLIIRRAEVSAMIYEALFNKMQGKGISITDFNLTNIDFSDEYNKAIEAKAVKQQEVVAAQAELEKAKIENEKKIENAKAEAEVMKQQNKEVSDKTLELKRLEIQEKLINKWNGEYPSTMLGNDASILFNMGK